MANIITGIRIVLSVALLFFPVLSPAFFVLYVAGGLSDMIDGAAARRTGTVSEFGSRLDTFADIVFAAVCLIKLLPILDVPVWLYVWFAVIAIIKFSSITAGYIRSFMHYRMELRLTMEIAVQKCLMQHVRMKEEFVFMEKWQINRFQLRELELNYAGGKKKW